MARKHIPVTIVRPSVEELVAYSFEAVDSTDKVAFIPFRYPFADISNYAALKTAGFFRHGLQQPSGGAASAAVSSELGGSATADAVTTLGYHLPPTEKLILLVKVVEAFTADDDIATITISGSDKYNQDAIALTIDTSVDANADDAGTIYEIDLYNFGLYIGDNGELEITVATETAADYDHLEFALVARAF